MWRKDYSHRVADVAPSYVPTAAATTAMIRSLSTSVAVPSSPSPASAASTVQAPSAAPFGSAASTVAVPSSAPARPSHQPRAVAATSSTGPLLMRAAASPGPAMRTVSPGPALAARAPQVTGSTGPVFVAQTAPPMAARSVTPPRSVTPTGRLVRMVSRGGVAASTGGALSAESVSTGQPLPVPRVAPSGTPMAPLAGARPSQIDQMVAGATAQPRASATAMELSSRSRPAAASWASPASMATPASSFGADSIANPVEGPRIERSVTPRREALVAAVPALSEALPLHAEASRRRSDVISAGQAVSSTHAPGMFMPAPPLPPPQATLATPQTTPVENSVVQAPPAAPEALSAGQFLPPPRPPTQAEEERFHALNAARHQGATVDPRSWVHSSTTQLLPQRRSSSPDAFSPYEAMVAVPGAGLLRPSESTANSSPLPQRPPSPGLVQPLAPALSPPPTVTVLRGPSPPGSPLGSLGSQRGSPAGTPPGSPGPPWISAGKLVASAPPLQVPQGLYAPSPPPTAPASPSMPRLGSRSPRNMVDPPMLRSRSQSPPPSRLPLPGSAAAAAAAAAAVVASSPAEGLAREVAAHEVELHVLRSEVAAREAEADNLRIKQKDTDAKLIDASGDVDTMSVKVETLAGNRHAVLKASAQHLEDQVEVLHKRLLLSEAELMEKDKEIRALLEVVGGDRQMVARQQHALGHFHMSQMENDEKARWLAEHEGGLKRKQAVSAWQENVRVNLNKESADIAVQREQRAVAEQCEELSSENAATRQFLLNLEQQCRRHALAMEAEKKKMDELLMEDRLSESTAKIGQQAAHTQLQSQLAEMEGLEVRLQREVARKSSRLAGAQAYAQHEVKAMRHMEELMSLTECLREITNVLRDSEQGSLSKDSIQRAVDEEVKLLRHIDGPTPSMVRISGDEYPVSMPMAYGQPMPQIGASFGPGFGGRSRSASPAPPMVLGREPSRPGTPVRSLSRRPSHSPARGPSPSPAFLPPAPGPGMPPSMAGMRSWGMPALVAPVSIGSAEPFMAPA